jgi:hypothetical protein
MKFPENCPNTMAGALKGSTQKLWRTLEFGVENYWEKI